MNVDCFIHFLFILSFFSPTFHTNNFFPNLCAFFMKIPTNISVNLSATTVWMRLRSVGALCVLCILFVAMSCSVIQPVRVLPEGTTQLTGSLGGPWLPKSSPAVIAPYLNLGVMHGVSEAVTLTGSLHGTLLPFGVLGLDAGAAVRVLKQQGAVPELTAKAQVYGFYDIVSGGTAARPVSPDGATASGTVRIYPHIALTGSYALTDALLGYVSLENTLQFGTAFAYYFTPTIGGQYALSPTVNAQLEWKWMAANVNTQNGIFQGQSSIGNTGNWGIFLGFTFTIAERSTGANANANAGANPATK
jgi:hypothetical protein